MQKYKPFCFLENNFNAYDSRSFFSWGWNTISITRNFSRFFGPFAGADNPIPVSETWLGFSARAETFSLQSPLSFQSDFIQNPGSNSPRNSTMWITISLRSIKLIWCINLRETIYADSYFHSSSSHRTQSQLEYSVSVAALASNFPSGRQIISILCICYFLKKLLLALVGTIKQYYIGRHLKCKW